MKNLSVTIVAVSLLCACVTTAHAGGFYFIPGVGAAIPVEGGENPAVAISAVGGYQFTSYLAAGLGYRFLYATGDKDVKNTHFYDANVTLFKRLVVVTP